MYGIPDRLKALSAAEEQVLLALWNCKPPVSRRDIGARLAEKGWAAATVLNFLYRLEEKGWVTCTKEQNHNLYAPTVTRRAYGVYTMRQRLDTVFGGDLAQAVRALVSESGCSQSELEQAIAVLNGWQDLTEKYHCTMAQLVIALTARMVPGLFVLCGARTPQQVTDNAGAMHIHLDGADAVRMKWDVDSIS